MPHTPGPWRVKIDGGRFEDGKPTAGVFIEASEYKTLAALIPVAEVEANANLFAAAPDLLKVTRAAWHTLQSLLAVRDGIPDDSLRGTADALQGALAKAEGR